MKFIEIPNFANMISKCSIGFVGHSGELAVRRHHKNVKQAIKSNMGKKMCIAENDENIKLKKEINTLKEKAK